MEVMSNEERIRKLVQKLCNEDIQACIQELKAVLEADSGELAKAEVA